MVYTPKTCDDILFQLGGTYTPPNCGSIDFTFGDTLTQIITTNNLLISISLSQPIVLSGGIIQTENEIS